MRPVLVLPLGLLAVALAATPVGAQAPVPAPTSKPDAPPQLALQLEYFLSPGARVCPGEERLHHELALRLGYDAFKPEGPSTPAGRLSVRLAVSGDGLTATYDWLNPDGKPRWAKPKTYSEEGTDALACIDVLKGIAVEIVWEFPLPSHRAQPPPVQPLPVQPSAACAPVAALEACPKVSPAVVEVEPAKQEPAVVVPAPAPAAVMVWHVEAGPWMDVGIGPRPMFGVRVEGGVQGRVWAVAAQVRWDPTASPTVQNGTASGVALSTRLLAGGFASCVHGEWHASFMGCLVGEVGQIQRILGSGGYSNFQQVAPYGGGGLGVGVGIPLHAHIHVQAAANILGVTKLASGPGLRGADVTTGNVVGITGGTGVALAVSF